MKYIVMPGRVLFSLIFVLTIVTHFSEKMIDHAVDAGVPSASFLVPVSGIIAFMGGISIMLGFKTQWGAWLIILFLVPVTFMMHAFWKETEPMQQQIQLSNFMKNISLIGAALLIAFFGAGPVSFDAKSKSKHRHDLKPGGLQEEDKKHPLNYFSKELKDN